MKPSLRFSLWAALSLALPALLLVATAWRNGNADFSHELHYASINWVFMAAPQILVIALALLRKSFLCGLASRVLMLLSGLLVAFQCWVWFFVPGSEGSLAWVLYIPLWVLALFVSFFYGYLKRRPSAQYPYF